MTKGAFIYSSERREWALMAKILCAMSGGVDSSVAAYLLKREGHDVTGVFLRLGPDAVSQIHDARSHAGPQRPAEATNRGAAGTIPQNRACCSVEDSRDAALVAARLDIPYYSLDYEGEFKPIIDNFIDEYNRGRTPIPCVLCNQWLKFGSLREKARALGCDYVATGHYARVDKHPSGAWQLRRGVDRDKDQSYFLFLMPKASLPQTLFPVGGYTKNEIRSIAREADLPVAEKPESQEICFVPGDDYREVLRAKTPERLRPGNFIDLSGHVLGQHEGHQNFTIGQRRGTGIALGTPHYVVALDTEANTVTLGERDALHGRGARLSGVQWTSLAHDPEDGEQRRLDVQIRHRHSAQSALVEARNGGGATVTFDEPQTAITPGQAAVFYDGDVIVGGGWIDTAE